MFERVDTFVLTVIHLDRAVKWYEEVIGFKLVFSGNAYRILNTGEGAISLMTSWDCSFTFQ
ncbi:VOC family protein [Salsuginibacillus kocurii]|uniref:VOC family protein n=1 Tax=Salsuginibacillus kocurii TaxID=427078 RepID=UPI000A00C471